jgi:hypothetical protein
VRLLETALGFLLGSLPLWLYNLLTGGTTVRFVLAGAGGGQASDRLAVLFAWWTADLPRGAGLWHPWGASPTLQALPLALLLLAALAWAVGARRFIPRRPVRRFPRGRLETPGSHPTRPVPRFARGRLRTPGRRPRPEPRPLDALLLLLLGIPIIFVLSGFGGPALNRYGFDATGRYAPTIWSALAVILGVFLAACWRRRRDLALGLAALALAINLAGWLEVDPLQAFQSPYWSRLPADNAPLLAALRSLGVAHVWLNHWAAYPVMFDARAQGQPLIAYDWYDVQAGGIDRFPEDRPLVEQADRAAFVLVTDEARPELLDRLDRLGVSYRVERTPPYVIVLPTSRSVHPSEVTPALDYRY